LKANLVMFCSHYDEQNALKSLEERSNFVLENHSQISVRTLYNVHHIT